MAFAVPIAFGQNTEDEGIKKVIRAETDAFYNRDADAWQNSWLHSAKISRTLVSNGSYSLVTGWDNYGQQMINFLKNNPKQASADIRNDSFSITSNGNMAWVEYKQITTTPGPDSNETFQSQEYRVLVKDNNEWKILSMITHFPTTFTSTSPQDIENSLNTTGYNLITAKRLNDAIEVFKLNVKLHPKAWNPYDSLGEAYALAGKKKEAIENYEKSVKLNPKNDNGIKALEKLRAK